MMYALVYTSHGSKHAALFFAITISRGTNITYCIIIKHHTSYQAVCAIAELNHNCKENDK